MEKLTVEELADRGINTYLAVAMAAQEARFINEQRSLGLIDLKEKPTTIALKKLADSKIILVAEDKAD